MKLVSFSVRDFRSITSTGKIALRDSITALIGPNNEGKSNVLRALVTALEIVSRLDSLTLTAQGRIRAFSQLLLRLYDWDENYPVALQESKPNGKSEFDLEFELTHDDVAAFREEVGSSLNGTLPIRLAIGKGEPTFTVRKQGRGAKALSDKAGKIAGFIGRRIDFQYIPALRPASASTQVIQEIVARELRGLATNPEYKAAVARIEELQQPLLDAISHTVRDTLKVFLPSVQDVVVRVPAEARYSALTRSCEVLVDDGTRTALANKGDGIQSLAAISLMRHASQRSGKEKQLILAIEEPESHLHPKAIHQLRTVLSELAQQHQVIITTHCPLFVDRRDLAANILVSDNYAERATSVQQIRTILGVRVSDNLTNAEVLLLVEGENDRKAISALLSSASKPLSRAIQSGILAVDSLLGGNNLGYKLSQARDAMCSPYCLLDYDATGKQAAKDAEADALITPLDVSYTTCLGMIESELEDWYDSTFYAPHIAAAFGVPPVSAYYTGTRKKWSERMRELFLASGKAWDPQVEGRLKALVADAVTASPETALLPARRSSFDNLVAAIEQKLVR